MIKTWNIINLILSIIAVIIIAKTIINYHQSKEIQDNIFQELNFEKKKLTKIVESCKLIARVKGRELYINELDNLNIPLDDYDKMIHEINILNKKNGQLVGHKSWVINSYNIVQDIVNNEIYFGYEDRILIACEASEFKINSKLINRNFSREYIIPITDTIKVEYNNYKYNYYSGQIDTFNCDRMIVMNQIL